MLIIKAIQDLRRVPLRVHVLVLVGGAVAVLLVATALLLRWGASDETLDSIAVVPFSNASANPNTDYLSDGITEELIDSLSQFPNLRVMARSTAFRYKGRQNEPRKVGSDLKVAAVVTGRLIQRGDIGTGQADLGRVADGVEIWSEHYNRRMADGFGLQQEIAKDISEKLNLRLSGEQQKQFARPSTESQQAYQLYLEGRYFWNQRTPESLKKSIKRFEQAVEAEPTYAVAYAGLADAFYVSGGYETAEPKALYAQAREAAKKALQLDDSLAEAHAAMGSVKSLLEWDWAGADQEFKRAIELNPGDANAHYFYACMCLGPTSRLEEAIGEMKKALNLDPMSLVINTNLARMYFFAGQLERAQEQSGKVLELDPAFVPLHAWRAGLYERKGMYEQAIEESRFLQPAPGLATRRVAAL